MDEKRESQDKEASYLRIAFWLLFPLVILYYGSLFLSGFVNDVLTSARRRLGLKPTEKYVGVIFVCVLIALVVAEVALFKAFFGLLFD
ncbi:hypothetical protein GCM10009555_106950 [Acrocarpospora macrocephala]|uniref:Uncharacterized protein n=2 Tax=Acrocarpospora macrocephala TaxID=150177 RepID=A0A5M3WZX0_9ACTN|nr:hypothetical protein Amac_086040 [Acrocarpospora macrocephala]